MKTIAAGSVLVAGITAATLLAAAPAQADIDRYGTCAGASFELSVDRERRGFEVDVDIERAAPNSRWRVKLSHDGKVVHSRVHRADREGEVDVDTWRRNTRGRDTFVLTVRPVGGASCSVRARLR